VIRATREDDAEVARHGVIGYARPLARMIE
jgi:hypothetical protein